MSYLIMNMCTYKMKEGYSTICSIYSDQNIKSERKCVCKAAIMTSLIMSVQGESPQWETSVITESIAIYINMVGEWLRFKLT